MNPKEKVVAIVQARMGSSRFPGKMLHKLGDYSLMEWVFRRLLRAGNVDQVVLATSAAPENDALQRLAEELGIAVFRGEESDVLGRFIGAARHFTAQHVIRICGDNPFIAPEEVDRLVEQYIAASPDYAFNHVPRLGNDYPDGLGAEIVPLPVLERLGEIATMPRHREHVTLYIWDHLREFRILSFSAPRPIAFPHVRLDVDTPEDLRKLAALPCASDIAASAATIVSAYRSQYGDGTA